MLTVQGEFCVSFRLPSNGPNHIRKDNDMSMQAKICLVTGGIGFVTAHELARQGAQGVVVGRNHQKTTEMVRQIREETGNQQVEYLLADLSRLDDVRDLASEFEQRYPRLDVLVNNVGGLFTKRRETSEGLEMTLALNYLSPFLLTNLLLPRLKASPSARIVNVSAAAHRIGKIHFEDLQSLHSYGGQGWLAYGQAKLASIIFTYELARRLESTNVTVNALHPGIIATNFGDEIGVGWKPLNRVLRGIFNRLALTPDQGAQTSLYLAVSSEVEGISGQYFSKCKTVHSSKASYDREAATRLWQVSEELTHLSLMATR